MTKQTTTPVQQQRAPQLSATERKLLNQIQACAKQAHEVVKHSTSMAFGFGGW